MSASPPPPPDGPARPRAFRLEAAPQEAAPAATPTEAGPASPPAERPRAFRLDGREAAASRVAITAQPDPYEAEAAALLAAGTAPGATEAATEAAQARGMGRGLRPGWAALFWSALGGLVSLGVSLWAWRLIDDLFARVPALGWLGLGLLGVAAVALAALAIREITGIARQRHVAHLHRRLMEARASDDGAQARAAVTELCGLYAGRVDTAAARAAIGRAAGDIIDGRDRVDLAERELMGPLDRQARREIAAAAKRVSLATTLSPRAVLDLVVVIGQIVVLVRRIAELYSGRPGLLGFVRLARSVGTHLAITGGMAVGDSLLQGALGHGLAARISARLGEGVLNGVLTTRVGLSAMAVCRPMPFAALQAPSARDVAPFLFGGAEAAPKTGGS